ncbi:MAG: LPS export ABC transporter permease LptG [Alphaproteobacteria bacterium]|nr:LPS export ABC transporter permease LptG [Alphaproteobacteria bacterium]
MKINNLISKYLIRSFLVNFIAVLFMILGIILMFEVIDLLRRVSDRSDVGFDFVLQMAFTKLPRTLEMVFPFVVMIAAMMTFWKFSKSNEFVVIRAAGVSVWGFLYPVLFTAFAIGVINIILLNPIASQMYEIHETLDYRFKTKNPKAMLFNSKGLWIREAINNDETMVFHAKSLRQVNANLLLNKITLIETDKTSRPIRRLEAFAGELNNGFFDLADIKIYTAGKETETISNLKYPTSLNIERIKENFIEPEAISFWDLPETIRFYELSGFSVQKHYMRYLTLLVSPFLLCAMIFVAAVFSLRPNTRKGGVILMIVGGVTTGFTVYFLSQVIYAFGLNDYIPIWLAVLSPSLITILFSVSLLLHLEDG